MVKLSLNEKIYGQRAIVYHGTGKNNGIMDVYSIFSKRFKPGAGDYHGKGLYTVYKLDDSATAKGGYGSYVVKMAVSMEGVFNLNACLDSHLEFDEDKFNAEIERVYKKTKPENKESIRTHIKGAFLNDYRHHGMTSTIANALRDYMPKRSNGIVYRGNNDGYCIAIFNLNNYYPISYIEASAITDVNSITWKKINPEHMQTYIQTLPNPDKHDRDFLSKQRSDFLSLQMGTSTNFTTKEDFDFENYIIMCESGHRPIRISKLVQSGRLLQSDILYEGDNCYLIDGAEVQNVRDSNDYYFIFLVLKDDGTLDCILWISRSGEEACYLDGYISQHGTMDSSFFVANYQNQITNYHKAQIKALQGIVNIFPNAMKLYAYEYEPNLYPDLDVMSLKIVDALPTEVERDHMYTNMPYSFYNFLKIENENYSNTSDVLNNCPKLCLFAYSDYAFDKGNYFDNPSGYHTPWEYLSEEPELAEGDDYDREDEELWSEEQKERAEAITQQETDWQMEENTREFWSNLFSYRSNRGNDAEDVVEKLGQLIIEGLYDTSNVNSDQTTEAVKTMIDITKLVLSGFTEDLTPIYREFSFAKQIWNTYLTLMRKSLTEE